MTLPGRELPGSKCNDVSTMDIPFYDKLVGVHRTTNSALFRTLNPGINGSTDPVPNNEKDIADNGEYSRCGENFTGGKSSF